MKKRNLGVFGGHFEGVEAGGETSNRVNPESDFW